MENITNKQLNGLLDKRLYRGINVLLLCCVLVQFFLLNQYTFWFSDDYSMGYDERFGGQISSLSSAFELASDYYKNWGGSFVIFFVQTLLCGVIPDKLVFNIINTILFGLFIFFSSRLIHKERQDLSVLFFALFWFCCPSPHETLFWVVGSTAYLWTCTAALVFLTIILQYDIRRWRWPLGVLAIFLAWTNIISSASICGAFVVITLWNIHKNGCAHISTVVSSSTFPVWMGFFIGACLLIFAPGNFCRQKAMYGDFETVHDLLVYCINACLMTFRAYRAVYLVIICLAVMFWRDRTRWWSFVQSNAVLLLSLAWSAVAFSFIFRPEPRAAFFSETIATIIIVKILQEYCSKKTIARISAVMFIAFCADYAIALREAHNQYDRHEQVIADLCQNDGDICFETIASNHRMVCPIRFDGWTRYGMSQKYDISHVTFHPLLHCKTEYVVRNCTNANWRRDIHEYAYQIDGKIVLKIPNKGQGLDSDILYTMRKNWQRTLRSHFGLYSYNRMIKTTLCSDFQENEFCYYILPRIEANGEEQILKVEI